MLAGDVLPVVAAQEVVPGQSDPTAGRLGLQAVEPERRLTLLRYHYDITLAEGG